MVKEHWHEQRPSRDEPFAVHVVEDLMQLTDREIKQLLLEIDTDDLATALRGVSPNLRERILSNLPEHEEAVLREALEYGAATPAEDIEDVHSRILNTVRLMVEAGMIQSSSSADKPRESAVDRRFREQESSVFNTLKNTPFTRLSLDEIAGAMTVMSHCARREGILSLGRNLRGVKDDILRQGLNLMVNGTPPEHVQRLLETPVQTAMHHLETRYRLILEGVIAIASILEKGASIQAANLPSLINARLRSFYTSARTKKGTDQDVSTEALKEMLQKTPFSERGLDDETETIVHLAILAQKGGIPFLKDVAGVIDDDLLSSGLNLLITGADQAGGVLEVRMRVLLHQFGIKYRLLLGGMMAIQSGQVYSPHWAEMAKPW